MANGYVQFDGVWKRFRRGEVHDSLRDLLPALLGRAVKRGNASGLADNEFWALRDLSFEVNPGAALGIIGANGAGKSTALKILTRILRPNQGAVVVRGRIGALIEIAAGFHPDLTGQENVFLQGSIMGMPLELIKRRFDEIVSFSGIEEFINTPVKRYSSGMNARLGFAIAAHLDPDVLIIDEVLAVGDFRYQERAFDRIRTLVTSGIPVVIVSHQLERIASLCTEAIVLNRGRVVYAGKPSEAIAHYLSGQQSQDTAASNRPGIRFGTLVVDGTREVNSGERVTLCLEGRVDGPLPGTQNILFRVRSIASGQIVSATSSDRFGLQFAADSTFRIRANFELNLRPGLYAVETYLVEQHSPVEYSGPIAQVQVRDDPAFLGTAQLKPLLSIDLAPERTLSR
jgi:lipopolysaccharide transport system ATP-binding protein